jgi:hypothetical protein
MKICFYGIPLAVLMTLTGTIKAKDKPEAIIMKIIATFLISVGTFIISMFLLFVGMCGWTTNKVLYENKNNNSLKIVERYYGCGAVDSDYPDYKTFKMKEISKNIYWYSRIDTNTINTSEWVKFVEPN